MTAPILLQKDGRRVILWFRLWLACRHWIVPGLLASALFGLLSTLLWGLDFQSAQTALAILAGGATAVGLEYGWHGLGRKPTPVGSWRRRAVGAGLMGGLITQLLLQYRGDVWVEECWLTLGWVPGVGTWLGLLPSVIYRLVAAWRLPIAELPATDTAPAAFRQVEALATWLIGWRHLRRNTILLVGVVSAVALSYAVVNWRAHAAWTRYEQQLAAQGEFTRLNHFIPPPVTDDQNFAMTPLLRPLLDYTLKDDGSKVGPAWHPGDGAGFERVRAINLSPPPTPITPAPDGWDLQRWRQGARLNLTAWQQYFRAEPPSPAPTKRQANGGFPPAAFVTNPWPHTAQAQVPAADILMALGKFAPELAELRAAARRPAARFPVHYEEGETTLLPHLGVLAQIGQVLALQGVAELELGQNNEALADFELGLHLADALKTEAITRSQVQRLRLLSLALQPVYEGLAAHRWSEAELRRLEADLGAFDLLQDYGRAVRIEAAAFNALVDECLADTARLEEFVDLPRGKLNDSVREQEDRDRAWLAPWLPAGLLEQNKLLATRTYYEQILPLIDPKARCADPDRAQPIQMAFLATGKWNNLLGRARSGCVVFPARFAHAQTDLDLARLACALERHWRAEGKYPTALAELVPHYLASIPADIFTGDSLHYHLTPGGRFVLYSVGWDQIDGGGELPRTSYLSQYGEPSRRESDRQEAGDWVWRYPEL